MTGVTPLVIAHRGASQDHPENTMAAFVGAREQRADWVELDVRRTADGELVVHHDPALADGRVIAEVRRRDLPQRVPTLTEALAACSPMGVNVEIKNSLGEPGFDGERRIAAEVVEVVLAAEPAVDVLISSFDFATIEAVKIADPGMATGYLVLSFVDPVDAVARALDGGHTAVHPWTHTTDRAAVDRCREAGLLVNVWTVDEEDRIAELAMWGVDGIVTNRPAVARRVLTR